MRIVWSFDERDCVAQIGWHHEAIQRSAGGHLGGQTQVEFALSGREPLPRRSLERLRFLSSWADPKCSILRDSRRRGEAPTLLGSSRRVGKTGRMCRLLMRIDYLMP